MWELDHKEGWVSKNWFCQIWCWRRLLRVSWTARRSNHSILKEINPGYSLEGLMLKLKLQYFGHLMQRTESLEKTLMLGKIEDRRRRGQQRKRWLDGITHSMDMSLSKTPRDRWEQGSLACCSPWGHKEWDMTVNWTTIWNLGKWYWWTCLHGRNWDTDIENRLVDTAAEGECGTHWASN